MKVFMAAVLNFNMPFMKSEELDSQEERPRVNTQKIGHRVPVDAEGDYSGVNSKLVMTDEDIAYTTKYFVLLAAAR